VRKTSMIQDQKSDCVEEEDDSDDDEFMKFHGSH